MQPLLSKRIGKKFHFDLKAAGLTYLELTKDPEKNKAELQRVVDEAARRAGYDSPKLYYGTRNKGFTVFDRTKSNDLISIFAPDRKCRR